MLARFFKGSQMSQSLFDTAMIEADEAIMNAFAIEHSFTLSDDSENTLCAIFDTKLVSGILGKSVFKEMKNGVLTVHNARLDKTLYLNAVVTTELGPRSVSEVQYPEEHTTVLILSALPKSQPSQGSNGDYF
jgi:hypothetical protein